MVSARHAKVFDVTFCLHLPSRCSCQCNGHAKYCGSFRY